MDDKSSAPQTEYKYTPLKDSSATRLLILYPASPSDNLRVSLHEASLETWADKFGALSYTWATEDGDCSLSQRVECEGTFINITVNCEAALRKLRQVENAQILWVDAICIDQSNNDEKSLQVRLMGQIYRKAKWVAIWIGEASTAVDEETSRPFTDLGMEFIHKFALELQDRRSSGQDVRGGKLYEEVVKDRKAFRHRGPEAFSPSVRGLWEVLHRNWWNRLWVVQELALARTAVLLCGSKMEMFGNLEVVIRGLAKDQPGQSVEEFEYNVNFLTSAFPQFVMRDFIKRTELGIEYQLPDEGPGQKALWLLQNTGNLSAADPRDKIYGVMAFFGDAESDPDNIFPAPDYNRSAAEVYSDVSRAIITKTKTLDIMSACHGFVETIPDLPSWARSWTTTPLQFFSEKYWHAANESCVVLEESSDTYSMKLKGKRVDVVENSAESPGNLEYTDVACTLLWRQWSDLAFSLSAYPTGESIAEVLLHTLCWDSNSAETRLSVGEYKENFEAWLRILKSESSVETVANELFQDEASYLYSHRIQFLTWGRCLCTTVNGYLGLVPVSAMAGDLVVVLSGGKVPFVLRESGDTYIVVGPCYMRGVMDGEAFPRGTVESEDLEWFTLV